VLLALLGLLDLLEQQAPQEPIRQLLALRVLLGLLDPLGRRVILVQILPYKALLVLQEHKARLGLRVFKVFKAYRVLLVQLEPQEILDLKVCKGQLVPLELTLRCRDLLV
jgi:hypothetical protein